MDHAHDTYTSIAEDYIDALSPDSFDRALQVHTALHSREKPIANTAVLIPVAAHQDGAYIEPALAEYAKQKTREPFTVALHLNAPKGHGRDDAVDASFDAIARAKARFPQLDIRHSYLEYEEPTIGRIRRDLWNAALLGIYVDEGFSYRSIGINHDIDVHRISPHYIDRIQQLTKSREQQLLRGDDKNSTSVLFGIIGTRVTHEVLPSHPNVGKVTSWGDATMFQGLGHEIYEAGLAMPLAHYMLADGFDETARTHETRPFVQPRHMVSYLAGAQLYTSPRRLAARLGENSTHKVWTDESFGASDACRDELAKDISAERAFELINDRVIDDVDTYWLPGTRNSVHQTYESQVKKAERYMRMVVGFPEIADTIRDTFITRK